MFDKACAQHIRELAKLLPLQETKTTLAFTTSVLRFTYTLHL